MPLGFLLFLIEIESSSVQMINKKGHNGSPCLTHLPTLKYRVVFPLFMMQLYTSL